MADPPGDATQNFLVHVQLPLSLVNPLLEWLSAQPAKATITAIHPGTHNPAGPSVAAPTEKHTPDSANRDSTVSEASLAKVRAVYDALKNQQGLKALAWSNAERELKCLLEDSTDDLRLLLGSLEVIDRAVKQVKIDLDYLRDHISKRGAKIYAETVTTDIAKEKSLRIKSYRVHFRRVCDLAGVAELTCHENGDLRPVQPSIDRLLGIDPKIHANVRELLEGLANVESELDNEKTIHFEKRLSEIIRVLVQNHALGSQISLAYDEYEELDNYTDAYQGSHCRAK